MTLCDSTSIIKKEIITHDAVLDELWMTQKYFWLIGHPALTKRVCTNIWKRRVNYILAKITSV